MKKIEYELISNGDFRSISKLNQEILCKSGFYCIRLKNYSKLPDKYQMILDSRKFKILYIGKAEGQTLSDRLNQELKHKKPGTFFRSIGTVLKYLPLKGHLAGKSNQYNFKFSNLDTLKIINWLEDNIEVSVISYCGNFDLENDLIKKYTPLLNDKYNPLRLEELRHDKAYCLKIARAKQF